MTTILEEMGAVPAMQLGHTGRKGSELTPWRGGGQLPPEHPDGWQVVGPCDVPYGGHHAYPVHELTVAEIKDLHRSDARTAERALEAGLSRRRGCPPRRAPAWPARP